MEAPVISRISLILEPPFPIREPHWEAKQISNKSKDKLNLLYLRGGDDQAKSDWWSWNCARGYQVTQVLSYYLIILPKKEEKRKRVNCMKSKKCLTLIQCVAMISILFGSKHLSNFNLFFNFTRFGLASFFLQFYQI